MSVESDKNTRKNLIIYDLVWLKLINFYNIKFKTTLTQL